MLKLFQLNVFLLLLMQSFAALAAVDIKNNPKQMLEEMEAAFAAQNYDGVFIYSSGVLVSTIHILHANIDGKSYERLIPLDGKDFEILHIDDEVTFAYPENENIVFSDEILNRYTRSKLNRDFSHLSYYQVKLKGRDRIANRQAIKLSVIPDDVHRYGYLLWLDAETKLLLKSVMHDKQKKILEHFQFTHISLDKKLEKKHFEISIQNAKRHSQKSKNEAPDRVKKPTIWQYKWMPPGFHLVEQHQQQGVEKNFSEASTFSDGLTSFSIFIERAKKENLIHGVTQKGATAVVTMPISGSVEPYCITVVGEIPMETAKKIALAVKKND